MENNIYKRALPWFLTDLKIEVLCSTVFFKYICHAITPPIRNSFWWFSFCSIGNVITNICSINFIEIDSTLLENSRYIMIDFKYFVSEKKFIFTSLIQQKVTVLIFRVDFSVTNSMSKMSYSDSHTWTTFQFLSFNLIKKFNQCHESFYFIHLYSINFIFYANCIVSVPIIIISFFCFILNFYLFLFPIYLKYDPHWPLMRSDMDTQITLPQDGLPSPNI